MLGLRDISPISTFFITETKTHNYFIFVLIMGKRNKRVAERTSSGADDVFKVKYKPLNKSKKSKPATVKNAKSVGVETCVDT